VTGNAVNVLVVARGVIASLARRHGATLGWLMWLPMYVVVLGLVLAPHASHHDLPDRDFFCISQPSHPCDNPPTATGANPR
jgi:hypothetical protein